MGLWLKQGDDIIPVSGGVGGGGGTFDGEHVLTGDPDDPPTDWEEGQLLWDGNTTSLDGDEIINEGGGHNHESLYLSLEGGTLTGDLVVNGNSDLNINVPADFWSYDRGTVFSPLGMLGGTQGSYATSMTANGYRNTSGTWTSLGNAGDVGATQISLKPNGSFEVRANTEHPTGSSGNPNLQFLVTDTETKAYGDLVVNGSATVEGNRVVTVTASTGTPPSGGEEGDIHIQV